MHARIRGWRRIAAAQHRGIHGDEREITLSAVTVASRLNNRLFSRRPWAAVASRGCLVGSSSMARWMRTTVLGLLGVGVLSGALIIVGWSIDETHFERRDVGFDHLTTRVAALPGVEVRDSERWVEAPTFSDAMSRIDLDVDPAGLSELLDATCTTEYQGTVSWSVRIATDEGASVSAHTAGTLPSRTASSPTCIDFGFDIERLTDAIGETVPGMDIQPMIGDRGQFTLVQTEEEPDGLLSLLPLVTHADDLREAAGLPDDVPVEINGAALGVTADPGDHDRYAILLCDLVKEHDVTAFWADDGVSRIDGVATVQIVAPEQEQTAVRERISASALPLNGWEVQFLLPEPTGRGEN
ncbi:hypothetical protein [Clavibacter phaseoli]|uniref:hypothetical protein n=1 Tax=Clavibacter phaseoli TaxID=1734031 RepID=UPI001F3E2B53|nr:hypothetical protein [Clavibacter phaseoli]UKF32493.1 hypothetical protein FGD69_15285 [Clavibacter phaseoli]UKF38486.1 hypothetical protein FGI33_15065 [Clavibacter phaseoli]